MPTWGTPLANSLPANQGTAVKAILDKLLANGHTIPFWSDGVTAAVNATPSVNPLSATAWNNNANCYVVVRDPGGGEWALQRGANANEVRYTAADVVGYHDGWLTFSGSATSGHKFTVSDGTATVSFVMVAGANPDVVVPCAGGASAAAQETAFLTVANAQGLAGTFVGLGTGTVYFVKTARTGYPVIANTNGSPLTAFAPSGTRTPVGYGGQGTVYRGGGGTDQSPTFEDRLSTFAGATYLNGVVSTSAPYVFGFWGKAAGNSAPSFGLMLDRVDGRHAVNQYSTAVYSIMSGADCVNSLTLGQDGAAASGWNGNAANKGWGSLQGMVWGYFDGNYNLEVPADIPANPFDGKDYSERVFWARASAGGTVAPPLGPKGDGTLFYWSGDCTVSSVAHGTRYDGASPGEAVLVGRVVMRGWNNTAVS
jgi:hypothetical protein